MSPRRALMVTAALAALSFAPLAAQVPLSEYATRRAALAATVDSGVVLAFGAVEPVNFWPTFQQHASFLYLTGFEEPDAVYVMVKRGGQTTETLFLPNADGRTKRWVGNRTAPAEVAALTGLPRPRWPH